MKVPLLDLKPQLESLHGEILEAVTRVVESTRYIMGPEIEIWKKRLQNTAERQMRLESLPEPMLCSCLLYTSPSPRD